MPSQKGVGRKRKGFLFAPYTIECLNRIMESELFSSETEAVEIAILKLYEQLKQESKLKRVMPETQYKAYQEIQRLVESGELEEGDEVLVDDATGEVKIRKKGK